MVGLAGRASAHYQAESLDINHVLCPAQPSPAAARKRNCRTGLPIVRQGASDYDDRLPVLDRFALQPWCVFAERRRRPDAGRRVDCRNLRARHPDLAPSPAVT
ncbi:MAG TPA: hypothetical protein DCE55_10195 [Planctomycetaceae bacterium]|nr:hypothetical protein [Planctomycetaceae bacterium]